MRLLIASNNHHKFQELSPSFQSIGIECVMPEQLHLSLPQEVEQYTTYRENAKAKTNHFRDAQMDGVLGDDSGLEVTALQGEPGLHSARFAGTGLEEDNRKLLLERMVKIPYDQREAKFVCVLCLLWKQQFHFFEGEVKGVILEHEIGKNGFGYDPLFYIPSLKKTFSQITPEQKLALSHRGKALEKCIEFLRNQLIPKVGLEPTRGCPH